MRPVRKKPYQEHTFALSIPLELDGDDLDLLKFLGPFEKTEALLLSTRCCSTYLVYRFAIKFGKNKGYKR
jgi:hypothetical protein